MKARTLTTLLALTILLLLMFWIGEPTVMRDPGIAREYKSFRAQGH